MVFIDRYMNELGRHIIIEETDLHCWAYLMKEDNSIDMDCWLYNCTEAPESEELFSEIHKYRQSPPPAPRDFLKENYSFEEFSDLNDDDFSFEIIEEKSSIIISVKNSSLAVIDYNKRCTYNVWLKKSCQWGKAFGE